MSEYDDIEFPDGFQGLNWDRLPEGYTSWVHYWADYFKVERENKRSWRSQTQDAERVLSWHVSHLGFDLLKGRVYEQVVIERP